MAASETWVPLDLVDFPGMAPDGPESPAVTFTLRMGLVETFKHIGQPNLVLASRLLGVAVAQPDVVLCEYKDLRDRGFPCNLVYCRVFDAPFVEIGNVFVPVPENARVFGVFASKNFRIIDYAWLEPSTTQPYYPNGHDDPSVFDRMLWSAHGG